MMINKNVDLEMSAPEIKVNKHKFFYADCYFLLSILSFKTNF